MRRREMIAMLGGTAVAWPRAIMAQPARPVIGYLSASRSDVFSSSTQGFRDGLKELGYVDGGNLHIEYRWAENRYDRLPAMAADLVGRHVALIAALGSSNAPLAAKAATSSIPILFALGSDAVQLGLVASLNRPGGNATGVHFLFVSMVGKRFELLHEIAPKATTVALILESFASSAAAETAEAETAAHRLGLNLIVVPVAGEDAIASAFATAVERKADCVVIGNGPVINGRPERNAVLSARYRLPTIANVRQYADAGGLMSYGPSLADGFRKAGRYAGRILNGEKPSDLPVQEADTFELAINLQTAKALGLAVPPSLLVRADAVIE
ncbi:MAG TPA: ABC transporter substrate-binding protein [Stellaceae bacterium]|nr:ABC transporter substrate-binding protein [Stellaceae bacterium]